MGFTRLASSCSAKIQEGLRWRRSEGKMHSSAAAKIVSCAAAAAWLGFHAAAAQPFRGFQALSVVPSEVVRLTSGEDIAVPLTLRVRPGYHINSNRPSEDYLIPTKLSWEAVPFRLKAVDYPAGEEVTYSFSAKPLSVYSGKIRIVSTFAAPESFPEGMESLTGSLRYQACNDKACFPPQTVKVKVPVLASGN